MKPYYDDGRGIVLYHGRAEEVLPTLPQVDLVLTDPPYNAGMNYGPETNDAMSWPAYCKWLAPIITQLEEKCAGMVLVFLSVNGLLYMAAEKRPRHVCVWDKPMSFSPRLGGSPFLPHWEPCAVYGRPWVEGGGVPNYHIADVWHASTAERNGHPCPKPLALIKRVLRDVPGDLICDPFAGSGTTLVAAREMGRKCVAVEVRESYCELIASRLRQSVLDFGPAPERPAVQGVLL